MLLLAAILVTALGMLGSAAWLTWRQAEAEALAETRRVAGAAASYARRVLDSHAQAAQRVNILLRGLSDAEIRAREPELHLALRALVSALPDVQTAHVLDRDGRPLLSTTVSPVDRAIDYSGREHHRLLAGANPPAVVLAPVQAGAADGQVVFAVARRRTETGNALPAGDFDGLADIGVDPQTLAAGLRHLQGRDGDVLMLVGMRGEVLASTQGGASVPSRLQPGSAVMDAVQRGDAAGTLSGVSPLDGEARFGAYQRVEGWPLYASASRSRADVASNWRSAMQVPLGIGIVSAMALLGLGCLVWRGQARLAAANARLEARVAARTAELAESEARLRRVQEIGRVGGFEIDLRTGANQRSAEYMRLQGRLPEAVLEQHWDWVARLHPADRARAEATFLAAISDESGQTRYAQDYRIRTPDGDTRWIAARAEIERDAEGHATRMVGAHLDVTELKIAQQAVAESATRLRAALSGAQLGVWERDVATGASIWDARVTEILGGHEFNVAGTDTATYMAQVHPEDREARRVAEAEVVKPGGPDHYELEYRIRRPDGQWTWVMVHGAVIARDPVTGAGTRLAGVIRDVTERREAEAQRMRLIYEVDHRARNALALVVAILRLTPRDDANRFAQAVERRVNALARLHAAIADRNWQEAAIQAVAEAGIGAAVSLTGGRVLLDGPLVTLAPAPAQALCMALHELAANAVLHGALASPGGRAALRWTVDDSGEVALEWRETGAAAGAAARAGIAGLGLTMLQTTVRHQLDGEVAFDWLADGLACRITIPPRPGAAAGWEISPSVAGAVQ